MNQASQSKQSGSYTANLLGNIRSHLAGLQGYDVMALELIQNADDAKAGEIVFDITHDGLLVRNSGTFRYCDNLKSHPCSFQAKEGYSCDFHRIVEVGSGGKLRRSENIGRFGIGFLSAFQVTDHPEVRSSGIKLTLFPESGKWNTTSCDQRGTTFFLPWAKDPNTQGRLGMGVSHITESHIDQIAEDFKCVLRQSLLFLRHIRSAEVRRDGELLLGCDLDRGDESDLIVSFDPVSEVEQWHILRADATDAAMDLCNRHPELESLDRGTEISIGLRVEPNPPPAGLLYAFLPTEQSSGLPLHINADFFPEPDRKAVIFAGHQHQQAWNEMLVEAAAEEIARDLEGLRDVLGHVQLWEVLGKAYELTTKPSELPTCYKRVWECIKTTGAQARIVRAQDGSDRKPGEVFLPPNPLTPMEADALFEAGGRLASEDLRPFRTAMNQLGSPFLTLERVVDLLESDTAELAVEANQVTKSKLTRFYRPLWSVVDSLLPTQGEASKPGTVAHNAIARLRQLPFIVTEDLLTVTIDRCRIAPEPLDAGRVARLLPSFRIASHHVTELSRLRQVIGALQLDDVVSHIESMLDRGSVEDVINVDRNQLSDLYTLFVELDNQGGVENVVYKSLSSLPIWRSSGDLIKATEALLPGNFTDPTGSSKLLDTRVVTGSVREFVSQKLGVKTLSIKSYIETVLPTFFNEDGPLDPTKYENLIAELADHPKLLDDDNTRERLGDLPIAPTQDGGWSKPANTYHRSAPLAKAFGDAKHLWLDDDRLPSSRSITTFMDNIGVRRSAAARHLVDRILKIADDSSPTDDAIKDSSEAFYVLCDNYEAWRDKPEFQDVVSALPQNACLPAEGDSENWQFPGSLHAPYRADAFRSQAKILDFTNTARLKGGLLEKIGVSIKPDTALVINHLKHCMTTGMRPHISTYQILNERADSDPLVQELAGSQCIYVESQQAFVRTNQVYWIPQELGRYAFTIPKKFDSFKPLFREIGVKDAPECGDYVEILLDLVGEHFEQSKPVVEADRAIYDTCFAKVSAAHEQGECPSSDLMCLQEAPVMLNLHSRTTYPDETLLHDSEWHASFFEGHLDQALCRLPVELHRLAGDLGVRKLSESASISLEIFDGERQDEAKLAKKLAERTDIFARLLHDMSAPIRNEVRVALAELNAVSYDIVRIQASVQLGEEPVCAELKPAEAFYDIKQRQLTLCRPVSDGSWAHILQAIFHQLIPGATGSEISKLTLSVRPLIGMSVENAHCELTNAGVPHIDLGSMIKDSPDLVSPELDELGTGDAQTNSGQPRGSASTGPGAEAGAPASSNDADHRWKEGKPAIYGEGNSGRRGRNSDSGARHPKHKARPKHKEQWDRRLISYVRQKQQESSENEEGHAGLSEYNLGVEAAARKAVCAYEKERGRDAKQMAQTHPGYDIVSEDPLTGKDRLIEVKGVNGEWNQTGVGLSRLQFSNAWDEGERYWLYVVEFALNPEHVRIHAIQNPAMEVQSFMFDGNWRDVASNEPFDPSLPFVPGTRVEHKGIGEGKIIDLVVRGTTKLLTIQYDSRDQPTPNVTLNVLQMQVLDNPDGDDSP